MSNIFDHLAADPSSFARQLNDVFDLWRRSMQDSESEMQAGVGSSDILSTAASRNAQRIRDVHGKRSAELMKNSEALASAMNLAQQQGSLWADWENTCLMPQSGPASRWIPCANAVISF